MSTAIRFEDVSKVYRLGESQHSLREAIAGVLRKLASPGSHSGESVLWALRNVSFAVTQGEALGLIGPNGAGKTTILKLLSSITQPTRGRIDLKGRVSALVELGAGFHPDLTGRENIYLNAAILGLSRREVDRLFDQIVAFSGLEGFIDTPVKRYSSGMYVRLGFSVAAHVDSDILLVDEVLAVGDSRFRRKCAQRIEELRTSGTTIVFVSHNLPLLRSVCDEAIFLADGQIQAQGDVVHVVTAYEAYLHRTQMAVTPDLAFDGSEFSDSSSVEITGIGFRGLGAVHAGDLRSDDAAEVRVHFWAREPVREPKLVVRIVRADSLTCCMIRIGSDEHALDDLAGRGVISVAVDPLQLTGGVYLIDARLMGTLDGMPLAHRHSRWFQVTGLSLDPSEAGGVFVPRIAWARVERGD